MGRLSSTLTEFTVAVYSQGELMESGSCQLFWSYGAHHIFRAAFEFWPYFTNYL